MFQLCKNRRGHIWWAMTAACVWFAVIGRSHAAEPAGTGFTYQGELAQSGAPANGAFDFRFRAFAQESGGAELGLEETTGVAVANGIFSVTIDFGAGIVTGEALWLAIEARAAGIGPYIPLSPRQRITPAPQAIVAGNALALGGAPASAYVTDAELGSQIAAAIAAADIVATPPTPAAPTELRLMPSLRGAPYRRLMWNMANFTGAQKFAIYESSQPITPQNKGAALRRVASTTELELPIFGNAGLRHFRVAAVNFAGEEGALSQEYALDTTMRVAFVADLDLPTINELYVAPAAGGGGAVKVNAAIISVGDVNTSKFSPDGTRIVYLADQSTDGIYEIYVAPAAGGGSAVKVNAPFVDGRQVYDYYFSPDGSRIVYIADQDEDDVFEIFVAPAAGGGTAVKLNDPLVDGGDVTFISVSPDGQRVAYVADQDIDEVNELYTAPITGGGPAVKINPDFPAGRQVFFFFYSPDGSRLIYTADQDTDGVSELYSAPADGSSPAVKINTPPTPGGYGVVDYRFSPDGTRIAYLHDPTTIQQVELFLAPAGGIATSVKVNPFLHLDRDIDSFSFSPDGTRLAFKSDLITDQQFELFVAPAAGGGAAVRVNPIFAAGSSVAFGVIAFSPDGTLLAYKADKDTDEMVELFVAPAAGGGMSEKVNGLLNVEGDVDEFAFTPDGSRILYTANQEVHNETELYSAPATGGGTFAKVNPPLITNNSQMLFTVSTFGFTP